METKIRTAAGWRSLGFNVLFRGRKVLLVKRSTGQIYGLVSGSKSPLDWQLKTDLSRWVKIHPGKGSSLEIDIRQTIVHCKCSQEKMCDYCSGKERAPGTDQITCEHQSHDIGGVEDDGSIIISCKHCRKRGRIVTSSETRNEVIWDE